MSGLRYFDNEQRYYPHGWEVFKVYFSSKELFANQYQRIQPDESKDLFLKVVTIYRYMVRDGNFTINHEGELVHGIYFDGTYKFITIMSLIEALYEEDKFMDFFSWLNRRDNTGLYPIGSRSVLTEIFNKYRARYGATQKVKKFFNSLSLIGIGY